MAGEWPSGPSLQDGLKGLGMRVLDVKFFFARVEALCVPRGTSHQIESNWVTERIRARKRTKPKPTKPSNKTPKTTPKHANSYLIRTARAGATVLKER